MLSNHSKHLIFLIILAAAVIAGMNVVLHPSKTSDNGANNNTNKPLNKANLNFTSNLNSNSSPVNSNTNNSTVPSTTKSYSSKDGSWQIEYDKSLTLSELSNQIEFKNDNIKIDVNTASQILSSFNGYVDVVSADVTVGSEKVKKITYDSRDHVAGYPTDRIIAINLKNQQIVTYFSYKDDTNAQEMSALFDNFVKGFKVN